MKRILLLLSLLLPLIVSAQKIQDTFFGQKLGSKISEAAIKKALEGKFSTTVEVEKAYSITAYTTEAVTFGGVTWEYASFCGFFEEQSLGAVIFARTGLNESDFDQDKESLRKALTDKYGEPEITEDKGLRWKGENGVDVTLSVTEETGLLSLKVKQLSLVYRNTEIIDRYHQHISDEI